MQGQHPGRQTVAGRWAFVPEPCTTWPCLPGMAWALQADDGRLLIVTTGGRWSDRPPAGRAPPQPGERVVLEGCASARTDVNGRPFGVIELGPC